MFTCASNIYVTPERRQCMLTRLGLVVVSSKRQQQDVLVHWTCIAQHNLQGMTRSVPAMRRRLPVDVGESCEAGSVIVLPTIARVVVYSVLKSTTTRLLLLLRRLLLLLVVLRRRRPRRRRLSPTTSTAAAAAEQQQ